MSDTAELRDGRKGRTTLDSAMRSPGRVALVARPFGYLMIGTTWLSIWLVSVLLLVGSVPYLAFVEGEVFAESYEEIWRDNPPAFLAFLVLCVPILAMAIGPGGWHVITGSWPLALLSFTYFVRSLRPSYANERLSFTSWAGWGATMGPVTLQSVSMSLQPVRSTAFTDAVMRFYVAGWIIERRMFLAMLPGGLAWPCAIVALMPEIPGATRAVFGAVTVVLVLVTAILGVRAFRARFAAGRAHVRPGEMTAKERARRLAELRRAREKRR